MSKRNGPSIIGYKLITGEKQYKFQIYVGVNPLTGKQVRTTRRGFKTQREAQLEISRIRLQIDKGTFRKQVATTYQDVYDLWVEQYKNTVEESTLVKTKGHFKNHILPAMGEYKIDKITVDACQKHVNEWFGKLNGFRSVRSYASMVIDFATARGFLTSNPMKLVVMPVRLVTPGDKKPVNFYEKEELIQFLKYLEKEGDFKAYAMLRLLAFSGMRIGEALALTWNDLDFKTNEIRINKALSRGKNGLYLKSTKNTPSLRTIKMDKNTMDILSEWREKQKQDYFVLGFNTQKPNQLLFSNYSNKFLQPAKIRECMVNLQERYNLKKITTHGLRHTHCSLSFESGVTPDEVKDRLGHSDIRTTQNTYTHVTEKAKDGAIQKFADHIGV